MTAAQFQFRLFTEGSYRIGGAPRTWKGNPEAIGGFFRHPAAFSKVCTFVHEATGEPTRGAPPTAWQLMVMHAWETYRFADISKPRQAKASEGCMRVTLKHTEYRPGCRAVLVVNKDSVAEDLFRRVNDHYENQPDEVRVPLRSGETRGTKFSIDFIHGGGITVVSAQERAPSVGASPRILWLSEFCKIPDDRQKETLKNLLPGGEKKPDLMVCKESTPGKAGSPAHRRWLNALAGKTRYYPIFLNWLRSEEYKRTVEDGWEPNEVERQLMEVYGASREHARFIHDVWAEFDEDWSAVWNMYPRDETDGWETTDGTVGFPAGVFSFDGAIEDRSLSIIEGIRGFAEFAKPKKDTEVLLTVDPAGWSNLGDPTGMLAFDEKGQMLGSFMGRVDPTRGADIVEEVCAYWHKLTGLPVTLAIESNKSDIITALRDRRREKPNPAYEFYNDRARGQGSSDSGWYSTESKKKRAETRLVANAKRLPTRAARLFLPSRALLTQLGSYDRSKAWARSGSGADKHHFELAICAIIAADVMVTLGWLGEAEEAKTEAPLPSDPRTVLINDLLAAAKKSKLKDKRKRKGILASSNRQSPS